MAFYQKPVWGIDFDPNTQRVVENPSTGEYDILEGRDYTMANLFSRNEVSTYRPNTNMELRTSYNKDGSISMTVHPSSHQNGMIDYIDHMNAVNQKVNSKYSSAYRVPTEWESITDNRKSNIKQSSISTFDNTRPKITTPIESKDKPIDEELFYRVIEMLQTNQPVDNMGWVIHNINEKRLISNAEYHAYYKVEHKHIDKIYKIRRFWTYGHHLTEDDKHEESFQVSEKENPEDYNIMDTCLNYWINKSNIESRKKDLELTYRRSFWENLKIRILLLVRKLFMDTNVLRG